MASVKTGQWKIWVGVGAAVIVVIGLSLAWDPMQRRSQLNALDACQAEKRIAESRDLAKRFAITWAAEHVRDAILTGRGTFEARVVLAATGHHRDLLVRMLDVAEATTAQRCEVATALLADWPDEPSRAPLLPAVVGTWVTTPTTDPELAKQAMLLLVAAASDGADAMLAGVAVNPQMDSAKAIEAVICACELGRRNPTLGRTLDALRGPHRAAILAAPTAIEAIRLAAQPGDAAALLAMLGEADAQQLAIAALSGPRFTLAGDAAARTTFAAQLARFLAPDTKPAVLAGALLVVRRQRLSEAQPDLLKLLPRLSRDLPPGLDFKEVAELYGHLLISMQTPEQAARAEQMIVALTTAITNPETRPFAAAAMSTVSEAGIAALRPALDVLAAQSANDDNCRKALARLVGTVYQRTDIVSLAERTTWTSVITKDSKRRARYNAMHAWMDANRADTSARNDNATLARAKAELSSYRDELRGWLEAKDPPPIGLSPTSIAEFSHDVQLMLKSVLSSSGKL
ncbi:MAG: hypothetical protein AAB263_02310 [Planctomycetota bacterium]